MSKPNSKSVIVGKQLRFFLWDSLLTAGAALGFAVFLTLVSSVVGVYYFEQSGDLNFRIRTNSVPVLEAAWSTKRETARLRALGLKLLSDSDADVAESSTDSVESILRRIEPSLQIINGAPNLSSSAKQVFEGTYELAGLVDEIQLNRNALVQAAELRFRLDEVSTGSAEDAATVVLYQALSATDQSTVDALWDDFVMLSSAGGNRSLADLAGGGDGIFAVRANQLLLHSRISELATTL